MQHHAHKVPPPYLPPASDAIALGNVRTRTGEHRAVAALDDLDLTYRVLVTEPGGVQRELARHVASLSEARRRAFAHFRELDRS